VLCTGKTAANVPVSSLGQQYVTETRALADTIQTYITIVSATVALLPVLKSVSNVLKHNAPLLGNQQPV